MGSSFTHLAVLGPEQKVVVACAEALAVSGFVAPTIRGWTLIAEEQSESFDFEVVRELAVSVSRRLGCPAVSVQFYDDDVLLVQVYGSGDFVESYSSNPAYGAQNLSDMLDVERGGDAERIAVALGKLEAVQKLQAALHGDSEELDREFTDLSARMSAALESGDIETVKAVQLRLMEKTREMSDAGDDPFLRFAPGLEARRRFAQFVEALGLPCFSQDFGFRYLKNGEDLEGLDHSLLIRIG